MWRAQRAAVPGDSSLFDFLVMRITVIAYGNIFAVGLKLKGTKNMIVKPQVAVSPASLLQSPASVGIVPILYLHQVWPPTILVIGLVATVGWISLLGYGLFELGELLF